MLHKAKWNEFPQSHCHRVVNSLHEIRKSSGEENEYVRFKDESERIKLFLLDIVNGDDEPVGEIIKGQDRFIA